MTFANGVRDVVLHFRSAEVIEGETPELRLHLRDMHYLFRETLHYHVHAAYYLLERYATATNLGDMPSTPERSSACE